MPMWVVHDAGPGYDYSRNGLFENRVVVTTQLKPLDSQEILVVSESAILMKREGDSFIKKEGSSFYKYYIREL